MASIRIFSKGSEPQSAIREKKFDCPSETLKLTIQTKIGKPIGNDTFISTVRSLTSDGLLYRVNLSTCYVLDIKNELPCFSQIKYIIMTEGEWYLCLKAYIPVRFLENAHAYEVECQPSWIVVLPQELLDTHAHRIYRKNAKTFAYSLFSLTLYQSDL